MIEILLILLVGFVIYMGYKINILEKKFKDKIEPVKVEKGDIVLKKLKDMPNISDVDPNHQLLKDVIETAKYEDWKAEIKEDFGFGRSWSISIENPTNTVKISTVLRLYPDDEPRIGYFNVMNACHGVGYGKLTKDDKITNYLIIEYLWSLIVKKNEADCQVVTESYLKSKLSIEKELKSLRRSEQLKKLFEDNLEV